MFITHKKTLLYVLVSLSFGTTLFSAQPESSASTQQSNKQGLSLKIAPKQPIKSKPSDGTEEADSKSSSPTKLVYSKSTVHLQEIKQQQEVITRICLLAQNNRPLEIPTLLEYLFRTLNYQEPFPANDTKNTPLHYAASSNTYCAAEELLFYYFINVYCYLAQFVNAQNNSGQTALHLAAGNGWLLLVELLVRCGAQTETQDLQGKTASDYATDNKQLQVIQYLKKLKEERPFVFPLFSHKLEQIKCKGVKK